MRSPTTAAGPYCSMSLGSRVMTMQLVVRCTSSAHFLSPAGSNSQEIPWSPEGRALESPSEYVPSTAAGMSLPDPAGSTIVTAELAEGVGVGVGVGATTT